MFKKLFVLILLMAGIMTWLQKDPLTQADLAQADELPQMAEPERYAFDGEGILVAYQSGDIPVYYLLYETKKHRFVRKELRFTTERGCEPAAGDLPCVYVSKNPVPVPVGSHIRVTGTLDAQRIIVERAQVVSDADRTFSIGTVDIGGTLRTEAASIRLTEVYSGGPCELFLGCYQEGIPRVRFMLSTKGDEKEVAMVPGMLENIKGGVVLLLWADESLGRAAFVVAHGEPR